MHPKKIDKVKLFSGTMFSNDELAEKVINILKKKFGKIDFISEEYPFDFTDYYIPEMGKGIKKRFISFKKLIDREKLAEIKLFTNSLEDKFAKKGNRTLNLDPGYLTFHNVVLASAKEMPHRIYLKKGIFGDVVLEYKRDKKFVDTIRTFPDFRSERVKKIMEKIRELYKKEF